jgi:photosystem II stability/assembly factor-like uncharacterized protein
MDFRQRLALAVIAAALFAPPGAMGDERLPGVAPADPLYDVAIVGRNVWIVGFPGILLHSSDGGTTFASQRPADRSSFFAVDFVDEKTGWVAGRGGQILATRDGGATWEKQATGTTEPLLAIDFVDASHGIAVGNFATAVRTEDGGRTWVAIRVAPEGEDPSLNGVAFATDREAIVVGEFGSVFRTGDGGLTWEAVSSGVNDSLYGAAALPGGVLMAAGAEGVLITSADGGRSFTPVATGTTRHLFRVTGTATRILVSGNGGTLLSADRPEGPYVAWKAPTYFWLGGARLAPDGTGFLVGGRTLVLRTADGGRTWKRWGAP